jgi:hypothetical protein
MGIPISTFPPFDDSAVSLIDPLPEVPVLYQAEDYRATNSFLSRHANWALVSQPGHTFIVGDAVKKDTVGTTYSLAIATSLNDNIGIVVEIGTGGDVDKFVVQFYGRAKLAVASGRYAGGLTIGATYFLSSSTAGAGTTTTPVIVSSYVKPLFVAVSSTDAVILLQHVAQLTPASVLNHVAKLKNTGMTGSALIPKDDTIPQISEGTEYISQVFTTLSASSLLRLQFSARMSGNTSTGIPVVLALFVSYSGSTNDARQIASYDPYLPEAISTISLDFTMASPGAGTVCTASVRFGPTANSGSYTAGVNRTSTTHSYGTSANSILTIQEFVGTLN